MRRYFFATRLLLVIFEVLNPWRGLTGDRREILEVSYVRTTCEVDDFGSGS
jgi:hypothetical protein